MKKMQKRYYKDLLRIPKRRVKGCKKARFVLADVELAKIIKERQSEQSYAVNLDNFLK